MTSVNAEKNLTEYIKGLIQMKHFQHRLDTLSVQGNNVKGTMDLNPVSSFVHLSKYVFIGPMIPVCVCATLFLCLVPSICLAACVRLDFRAPDASAHDWMVMSSLWKASGFVFYSNEDRAANCIEKAGAVIATFVAVYVVFTCYCTANNIILQSKVYASFQLNKGRNCETNIQIIS